MLQSWYPDTSRSNSSVTPTTGLSSCRSQGSTGSFSTCQLIANTPGHSPTSLTPPRTPTHSEDLSKSQWALDSCSSWDSSTFPETSNLLPEERNGDWRSDTLHAIKHPSSFASSTHDTLQWPHLRDTLTQTAASASEAFHDRLNHAFEGQDLPAMHDKMLNLIPSVSMPTMRQVSQSMDSLTDKAQSIVRRRSSPGFTDEEFAGDQFAFARHMGAKARGALVNERICKEWQILPTRSTLAWRSQLDAALIRLFLAEKRSFSISQLFSMTPVWTGDIASKNWQLELDTGLMEIVVEGKGDKFEERCMTLEVSFELPEEFGCLRIKDVERRVMDHGEWAEILD